MSLPLCTPDKIECVTNLETEYEECLPQCSELWINSFYKDKTFTVGNSVGLGDKKILELSKQYWKYKGFYKFPSFKGCLSKCVFFKPAMQLMTEKTSLLLFFKRFENASKYF